MNQHQRKFLLEAVEKQYEKERDEINSRRPKEPSFNNYLIAAILDGSFKMRDQETIRAAMLARVRDLGKGDALVSSESWGRRNEDDKDVVKIPADVLFELPSGYATALAEYNKLLAAHEAELEALEASIGAMRIKVQIGSDKALEALVDQADKLCSMSLTTTNQLLLGVAK